MKRYLLIFILLSTYAFSANTYDTIPNDYSTLKAALEVSRTGYSAGDTAFIIIDTVFIDSSGSAHFDIDDFMPGSSTNTIMLIKAVGNARTAGLMRDTNYTWYLGNSKDIECGGLVFDGIQFEARINGVIFYSGATGIDSTKFTNCIFDMGDDEMIRNQAFLLSAVDLVIINCLFFDTIQGGTNEAPLRVSTGEFLNGFVYNTTFYGTNEGATDNIGTGTWTWKNIIIQEVRGARGTSGGIPTAGADTIHGFVTDTVIVDMSSTDTANVYDSAVVAFVSIANEDFRQTAGDTVANERGLDLSSDNNQPFTTDIAGTTRPIGDDWDLGFFEAEEAVPSEVSSRRRKLIGVMK